MQLQQVVDEVLIKGLFGLLNRTLCKEEDTSSEVRCIIGSIIKIISYLYELIS